jgi:hypothetical protein
MSVNPIDALTNVSSLEQPNAAQLTAAAGTVLGSATAAAAQTAPTADAAQAWEEAMRAAMGDESAAPAAASAAAPSATAPSATAPSATAPSATAPSLTATAPTATAQTGAAAMTLSGAPQTALTPQALAALVSGSAGATTNPLITSLSAPSDATTAAGPASDGGAGSYL